jgi:hypothetical protein
MRGTIARWARGAAGALLVGMAMAAPARAQTASIAGRVTDGDGRPVAGATVRVLAEGSAVATVVTQEGGGFQASAPAAGAYLVRAEAAGYAPAEQRVTVMRGERITVVLRLRPAHGGARRQEAGH